MLHPTDPHVGTVLVRGGRVVDPELRTIRDADVLLEGGLIAEVVDRDGAEVREGDEVVDVDGALVMPGLIDLHAHVFAPRTSLGIPADQVGIEQSVTTLVDAGSTGSRDFADFSRDVVEPARTRVLSWLNIADQGLVDGRAELADLATVGTPATVALLAKNPSGVIRGIKVRMSESVTQGTGLAGLERALELAEATALPVMVHVGNEPPSFLDVAALLRPGDVITHAFHGKPGGIFRGSDEIDPVFHEARDRGVLFDVGHGSASLSFEVARKALAAGFSPDLISTDIHVENLRSPVESLALTMTKMLALGMDLIDVVHATTARAASVIGESGRLGSLAPGAAADLSVLRMVPDSSTVLDAEGSELTVEGVLIPQMTIANGAVVPALKGVR